jgi:steroid delta-isomerase-like uncharacterized protein
MTPDQTSVNKTTLSRFHDVINTGEGELISTTIDELFDPNVLIRTPLPVRATGAAAMKEVFRTLRQAFPDLHVTIEDLVAEGDKVVSRNVVTGTHEGEYMGVPPTGRLVTYNEIFILRFVNGRIAETWGVVDLLSQMRQLGVIPEGPTTAPRSGSSARPVNERRAEVEGPTGRKEEDVQPVGRWGRLDDGTASTRSSSSSSAASLSD